jgi:hypothetical protein
MQGFSLITSWRRTSPRWINQQGHLIGHLWDKLGCIINNIDSSLQNINELRQVLLDRWAEITAECLQHLLISMPHRLAAIIRANGAYTR